MAGSGQSGVKIEIKIENLDKLVRAFQKLPQATMDLLVSAMLQSQQDIAEEARDHHKFTSRHGQLERAVTEGPIETGPLVGRVWLDTNVAMYAPFIHEGTGLYGPNHAKYPISPKAGHFFLRWESGGQEIWARKVMHPGVKSDPFLYEAAKAKSDKVNQNFATNAALAIKGAGL